MATPPTWRAALRQHHAWLEVEVGLETATSVLCEGERLVIRHEQEEIQLTREQPAGHPAGQQVVMLTRERPYDGR